MRRVLVTGGAGFIGAAVVRRLLNDVERVVTLDALTYAGSAENLTVHPQHRFVHGDVRDAELVRRLLVDEGLDAVVHLAAESHVDRSISGPEVFVSTNIVGTSVILEAARACGVARLVQVSTDEVYGDIEPDAAPCTEHAPYRPSSPYAASKAAADHLVRAWHRTYGVPVVLTHGCNTYGPGQYPEKLLPVVVHAAVRGQPIPVYGDGLQVRDWLYVDDHADAIAFVARHGASGASYNIAGGAAKANMALIRETCAVLDEIRPGGAPHARWITRVADRPGHDRRYAVDGARLRALGWAPRTPWADGLRRTVAALAAEVG